MQDARKRGPVVDHPITHLAHYKLKTLPEIIKLNATITVSILDPQIMSSPASKLEVAKAILSTVGSVAATAMVVRTFAQDYLPHELQHYLSFGISSFFNRFSSDLTMVIDEFDGLVNNEIYEAAELYLGAKISPQAHRLKVSKPEKDHTMTVAVERDVEVCDLFDGAKFKWLLVCQHVESKNFYNPRDTNSTLRSEVRSFELTFHKRHKDKALNSYLPYILSEAKSLQRQKKTVKIFTVNNECMYSNFGDAWNEVNLDHPAAFETLAMDSKQKETIVKDLDRFVKRREFYRKVGKAWKRGYLLYGPPGTGKSSLIAAMANYLNFDIYDLELTDIRCNSDLRRLLLGTANRSILVVEDIDCTIELKDRAAAEARASNPPGFHQDENKVTLSGFLNFVDGLWSSCGDERIIVFTTNHIEKLDPALLRPGRMDVHVHMSYCTPCGFRILAANYLDIKDHELFAEIGSMVESTEVTPAEVAEQLLKSDDPDAALAGLIDFLREKRKENEEAKAKKVKVVESVEKQSQSEQQNEGENVEAKAKRVEVVASVEKQSQSEQQNESKNEEKQN